MASWNDLVGDRAELAETGRALLYQHGVGLAYLATTRPDGGPRVHPVCPLLTDDGMFAFIIPSPKQRDLLRDGRYAMHSFPSPHNEDAFYVSGRAGVVEDQAIRAAVAKQFVDERFLIHVSPPADGDALFAFSVDRCLLTRTSGHGDPTPNHVVWQAT